MTRSVTSALPPVDNRKQARNEIILRRTTGLTQVDKSYLDFLQHDCLSSGHDPIRWYFGKFSSEIKEDDKKRTIFFDSLLSTLKQRNFGYLSKADELYLNYVKRGLANPEEALNKPFMTEHVDTYQFVITDLKAMLDSNCDWKEHDFWPNVSKYIDALEEMLQLSLGKEHLLFRVFNKDPTMSAINRDYIDYLHALVPKAGVKDPDSNEKRRELLQALGNDFQRDFRACTVLGEPSHERKQFLAKRELHTRTVFIEIRDIINAYAGDEKLLKSNMTLLARKHDFAGKLETQAGKYFAEFIHHLVRINAGEAVALLQNEVKNDDVLDDAQRMSQRLNSVVEMLYDNFELIQNSYYQRLDRYYNNGLLALYRKITENPDQTQIDDENFKRYCNLILFGGTKEQIKAAYNSLIEKNFEVKKLGYLKHSLTHELKPLLDAKKESIEVALKHLKKGKKGLGLSHFVQELGLQQTALKRRDKINLGEVSEPNPEDLRKKYFRPLYVRDRSNRHTNYLMATAKQVKRQRNGYANNYGPLAATLVGLGEGIVAGVALWAVLPIAAIPAAFIGAAVFLSGACLNYFLLRLDSIAFIKAFRFSQFSKNADKLPMSRSKKALNISLYLATLLGTGLVFASVFALEFMTIATSLIGGSGPGFFIMLALAGTIALIIGFAELFGISALIHMANNNILKQGFNKFFSGIKNYIDKRFYVALEHNWDSFSHVCSNLFEIFKHSPRLLISTLLTATGLATMAYYLKMTFVFFSGCVAGLVGAASGHLAALTGMQALKLGTTASTLIGKVAAGMNGLTTLMTFTVPLGKFMLKTVEAALSLPIMLASLAVATVFATLASPVFVVKALKGGGPAKDIGVRIKRGLDKCYSTAWNHALTAHTWLTTKSVFMASEGGLQRPLEKADKTFVSNQKPSNSGAPREYHRIFLRECRINFYKKCLAFPALILNGCGQVLLFMPKGFSSFGNPLHVVEGVIQGMRSTAMNANAVVNNINASPAGYPLKVFDQPKRSASVSPSEQPTNFLPTEVGAVSAAA